MNKRILLVVSTCLLLFFIPKETSAITSATNTSSPIQGSGDSTAIAALTTRLHEIRAIDKSDLSSAEKKEIRNEKQALKKDVKALGGGVYLSAGALIVIVLLLILLL